MGTEDRHGLGTWAAWEGLPQHGDPRVPTGRRTWLSEKQRGLSQTEEAASAQAQGEKEVQVKGHAQAGDRASQGLTVTKELSVLF